MTIIDLPQFCHSEGRRLKSQIVADEMKNLLLCIFINSNLVRRGRSLLNSSFLSELAV